MATFNEMYHASPFHTKGLGVKSLQKQVTYDLYVSYLCSYDSFILNYYLMINLKFEKVQNILFSFVAKHFQNQANHSSGVIF